MYPKNLKTYIYIYTDTVYILKLSTTNLNKYIKKNHSFI